MTIPDVLCLRPAADFTRVGVAPPGDLKVTFMTPADAAMPAALKAADALVIPAVGPKLPLDLFKGSGIRLVQVTGAGVDRVDPHGLEGFGIRVANVPGGSNEAVAEYAVSCASVLLRRFHRSSVAIRHGNYAEIRAQLLSENVQGIEGLLTGVVGLGTIGTAVARRFKAAGARIAFYDPAAPSSEAVEELEAQALTLDELLSRSDMVSLHVPLLAATENLINAERLSAMKPGAILIQVSRGGVVDEAALVAALELGQLGGAAVDVFSTEPPATDNPLLRMSDAAAQRTILTPHIAGVTRQASTFLFQSAWDNVRRVLIENQLPRHVVS